MGAGVTVTPVRVDAAGRVLQQGNPVRLRGALDPGQQVALDAGLGVVPAEQLPYIRFRVDAARAAGR